MGSTVFISAEIVAESGYMAGGGIAQKMRKFPL